MWPHGLKPARLFCPWNFSDKSTGKGCHFLLQGLFLTQGSNPCLLRLLYWQADSLLLHHLGSPHVTRILSILFLFTGCFYFSSCHLLVYFKEDLFTHGHLSINLIPLLFCIALSISFLKSATFWFVYFFYCMRFFPGFEFLTW